MFNFIQWNVNGFYARKENITLVLAKYSPDIMGLQETNFKDTHTAILKGYRAYARNRINPNIASGGVAIYIKDSFTSEEVILNTTLEAIAIKIQFPKKITVCSIYMPNSQKLNATDIENLIRQLPRPFLILGDFNSHNTLWGSQSTDTRGKCMEQILDDPNITLLNTGAATHFAPSSGTFSAIDLSISSAQLAPTLTWEASPHLYDSDHFPIQILLSDSTKQRIEVLPRWKLQQANWDQYAHIVDATIDTLDMEDDLDNIIKKFTQIIINAAEESIDKTKPTSTRTPAPWWNSSCAKAIKESKTAFYRYKKHPTLDNLIAFKRLRAKARRTVKERKKASWKEYVQSINRNTSPSEIWNKIRQFKKTPTSSRINVIKYNDNNVTTSENISEALANTFSNTSSNANYDQEFVEYKNNLEKQQISITYEEKDPINSNISKSELDSSLKACRNSAPGPDNVPFLFLQKLTHNAKTKLLNIYNLIWTTNQFPKAWQEATVIAIYKPGKDKTNPLSYRPISLTCTMCKVMEKIINRRMCWFLERNNLFTKYQSGFRQGHSTYDNLITLESDIREAFANKQHLIAICFDLEKAFDMTWRYYIIKTLHDYGLNGNILAFCRNFLEERRFRVRYNGIYSSTMDQQNGVPQGSTLSVTLFLVAINNVASRIQTPVKISLFADDLTLYCKGRNVNSIQGHLQSSIEHLVEWTKQTGFKFSLTKTNAIHFTRQNLPNQKPRLTLRNHDIKYVDHIKLLGMVFDKKLTWSSHLEALKNDCKAKLNIMKALANHEWGADTTCLLQIYKAVIRSRIDYGSIVYMSAKSVHLNPLNVIQNNAIRIATGAFVTSPTAKVLCNVNEPPLSDRRKLLSLTYATTVASNPQNPVYQYVFSNRFHSIYNANPRLPQPFHRRLSLMLQNLNIQFPPIILKSFSEFPPWTFYTPNIKFDLQIFDKMNINHDVIRSNLNEMLCQNFPSSDYVYIFTDASKSDDGVGSAFVTPNNCYKFRIPTNASVFTGEVFAIIKALEWIQEQRENKFILFSDSKSALQAIKNAYTTEPLIQQILQLCTTIEHSTKNLTFFWIPSHIGILGNEQADWEAKEAVTSPNINCSDSRLTVYDAKKHLRTGVYRNIHDEWKRGSCTRPTGWPDRMPWKYATNRRLQIVLTRITIGHTRLTHSHLLQKADKPKCDTCNVPLTIQHIITECKNYKEQRKQNQISPNLNEALQNPQNILNFLDISKLLNVL